MRLSPSLRFAAVALMSTLSSAALADVEVIEESHVYPAASCQGSHYSYDLLQQYYGRVFNVSTTSNAYFDCPIVKRHGTADTNAHISVDAIDMHYSEDVRCSFYVLSRSTPHPYGLWSSASTSGTSSSPQRLYLSNAILPGQDRETYDLLTCYVPESYAGNRSGVAAYEHTKSYVRY